MSANWSICNWSESTLTCRVQVSDRRETPVDFCDQNGAAYWCYVRQADRAGKHP